MKLVIIFVLFLHWRSILRHRLTTHFILRFYLKQLKTYISILKGINVGGHHRILMEDLKKLFSALNLCNAVTYIQSGNVVFNTGKEDFPSGIAEKIALKIKEKYGFEVPLIVRTIQQWKNIVSKNPFLVKKNADPEKCYVVFFFEKPDDNYIEKIKDIKFVPDEFVITEQEAFLYIPGQYHESKLSCDFFEKNLKVKASCRNWKTVLALEALAEKNAEV